VFWRRYGVPLLGRIDVSDYRECPIYSRCRSIKDRYRRHDCIYRMIVDDVNIYGTKIEIESPR